MDPEFAYTKHQTQRGAMADAEVGSKIYLIKNVSGLRLTYQIRLLAYSARCKGKALVIRLPTQAMVHSSLREFVRSSNGLVKFERS